ncbi:MAG: Gfo/Idh/MocA family oxidoreductase [Lachnospiraceae bacterium]|nr:Gfo/Idh/MocA family oxidoreductase [Lachnospiraceae bacterium]
MLKVGLIGCGFMGTMHANCYKNIEGVELVAVADIRREKAEALAAGEGTQIFGDGMDLIAQADVDVIDVCLPTFLHAKYALAAMDKVKYLFVEKPVTLTVEESEAMIAKSKETGCQVQIGQVIRFWDEYVELKKIVDAKTYGKLINANFRRISPRPDWGWQDWLLDATLSGGAAQDLHIHDIDYALSLFGEPENFYSAKNVLGEKNSYINTLMKYDDFVVTVEGTWGLPGIYPFAATFRVVFEDAVVENAGGKFLLYTDAGVEEIVIEKKQLAGQVEGGNISDLGGYYNELVYFCERAAKQEPIDKATLVDAAASLKFLMKEIAFGEK